MTRLRHAFSLENVLVTVVLFAVLGSGAAYAATHLGKKSVGAKQLKKNSVTAAKIKKNAVTTVKIKTGAVSSEKVADGSVGSGAFDPTANPFSGTVASFSSSGSGTFETTSPVDEVPVPLADPTFVQQPGEADFAVGQAQLSLSGTCAEGALLGIGVFYDSASPTDPTFFNREIGSAFVFNEVETLPKSLTVPIAFFENGSIPKVSAPTNRTLSVYVAALCAPGSGSVTASDVHLELIGVKG